MVGDGNVAPRVVFPTLHQNGSPPPGASVSPTAPTTAANGTMPNNEPDRIKTLPVKGDASEHGDITAAPQTSDGEGAFVIKGAASTPPAAA